MGTTTHQKSQQTSNTREDFTQIETLGQSVIGPEKSLSDDQVPIYQFLDVSSTPVHAVTSNL